MRRYKRRLVLTCVRAHMHIELKRQVNWRVTNRAKCVGIVKEIKGKKVIEGFLLTQCKWCALPKGVGQTV